jgi:chaperonin GroEL (HSP60 family)
MLVVTEMNTDIRSSFGPFGRCKIVRNQLGGSLIITKDGQQLLECILSNPSHNDTLQHALIQKCCSVSTCHGDGTMSALIIISHIVHELTTILTNRSKPITQRILLLNALEVLMQVSKSQEALINQHMINASIWCESSKNLCEEVVFLQQIKALWMGILLPATNANTATNLLNILVSAILYKRIYMYTK